MPWTVYLVLLTKRGLTVLLNIPHHLPHKAQHLYCLGQDEEWGHPANPEKPWKTNHQNSGCEITMLLVFVNCRILFNMFQSVYQFAMFSLIAPLGLTEIWCWCKNSISDQIDHYFLLLLTNWLSIIFTFTCTPMWEFELYCSTVHTVHADSSSLFPHM